MATPVPIEVFQLSETRVIKTEVLQWMERLDAQQFGEELINEWEQGAFAIQDPALLVALAAKRCYKSFEPGLNPNVTKVRKDWTEYFDNILKSGHGSVLEHAVFSFAIEGLTRVSTAELNRHRAGVAISEGSMRYIRWGDGHDVEFWMPDSLKCDGSEDAELMLKKQKTEAVFYDWFEKFEAVYQELLDLWADEMKQNFQMRKKLTSMFRRLAPMGVSTGGVWMFNVRALRHIVALRSTPHAEEEIAYIVGLIMHKLHASYATFFGDFEQDEHGFWVPKYPKV